MDEATLSLNVKIGVPIECRHSMRIKKHKMRSYLIVSKIGRRVADCVVLSARQGRGLLRIN